MIDPVKPVAGEDYATVMVREDSKLLSVKMPGGETVEFDVAADRIHDNLRSIAIKAHFLFLTTDREEVTVQELFESGRLSKLLVEPVEGEDYNPLIIKKPDAVIVLKRANGQAVRFDVVAWLAEED